MTDTEKWGKKWFQDLPTKMKLLWLYLCDRCDHAGIWSENLPLACFQIGESITQAEYEAAFGRKMIRLEEDKVFFPGFIQFQYEKLSRDCKPHLSVIRLLERYGIDPVKLTLSKGLRNPMDTPKDKDKDQDQEKQGGLGGIAPLRVVDNSEAQREKNAVDPPPEIREQLNALVRPHSRPAEPEEVA